MATMPSVDDGLVFPFPTWCSSAGQVMLYGLVPSQTKPLCCRPSYAYRRNG